MVRIRFPTEGARKIESWGPGFTRLGRRQSGRRVSRVPGIPRRTSTRWSSSPGVIPGRVSIDSPGGLQHNSREFPTVYCWIQIPQKAAEEVLEAWNHTRRWNGVVLEAWCYTRAAGAEVVHVAATGFQGVPDCVARYKFPRRWR